MKRAAEAARRLSLEEFQDEEDRNRELHHIHFEHNLHFDYLKTALGAEAVKPGDTYRMNL